MSTKKTADGASAAEPLTTDPATERMTPQAKSAAKGAWFGLFVDYFDIYLPIVALAPALGYFMAADLSATEATTFGFALFAAAFLGRPIGTFVFGHLGDKIGRKRTTLIAAGGVTVTTFLVGALPGYAVAGVWALILLPLLRLVGGVFMGGQYTSANPLAIEGAPRRLRGQVGGIIAGAYPLAYVAISLVTFALMRMLNGSNATGPYQQWGWRIPFVIGGVLSLCFFFYYRKEVQESAVWEEARKSGQKSTGSPLKTLFSGENRKALIQVFVLMTGLWFGIQILTSATPTLLISYFKLPGQSVTWGLLIANVVLAVAYPLCGLLGQRFGRRRMLSIAGVGTVTLSAGLYWLMISVVSGGGSLPLTILLVGLCLVITVAPNAMIVAYLCERFPTNVRSSGYGIGYTVAVVIPSFYSAIMLQLGEVMSYRHVPVLLLVVAGVLTFVGARMGPETNKVSMDD
ncbi:MFS transporter [Amycolatopsis methanolica]|uniref:MFS transporter n=1 Tax=Amycolatopsis methanolica TaxID=1814 RepID=UPI00343CF8E3